MLYYHLSSLARWSRFFYIFTFLTLFISTTSGNWFTVDWLPRLDINENYLHLYPILWTNFWFLPPFYFFLIFYFITTPYMTALVVISYWVYITELVDFSLLNYTYVVPELNQFNNLLTNNLNKYHPFLFFCSTHFCFKLVQLVNCSTLLPKPFRSIYTLWLVRQYNRYLVPLILTALTLGGVWAFHEASWGGFWNWDSSETFGLLFLLMSLNILHTRLKLQLSEQFSASLMGMGLLLAMTYCFLQLNFDLLSHNFGIKFLHLFSNSFFYKEVICLTGLAIAWIWLLLWWDRLQNFTLTLTPTPGMFKQFNNRTFFWWQLICLYVLLLVGYSLTQLINYTIFSLFQVNWFNFNIHLPPFIILAYLYLTFWFIIQNKPHLFTWSFLSALSVNVLYCIVLNNHLILRTYHVVHLVLLSALLINILAYKVNFLLWTLVASKSTFSLLKYSLVVNNVWYVCDSLFVDNVIQYNTTAVELNLWVTNFTSNTPSVNQLLLVFHNLGCYSLYHLTSGLTSLVTVIVIPYVNLLWGSVCITLVLLKVWYSRLSTRF